MIISLIWAMSDNRVIGIHNSLPWKLPADMKWFRQNTVGKPIIMGRKTFESFGGKPLPQRQNIIVTNNPDFQADNTIVTTSIEDAIRMAGNAEEVMIIGGASLYQQTLPRARRLYMTLVHANVEGDAWFPQFDLSEWDQTQRIDHQADENNPYSYSFIVLERKELLTVN